MADKPNYNVIGKLFIKAQFKLDSPLIIGCGENENADIDVIRDNETNPDYQTTRVPIIPASSIVGVFRSLFNKAIKKELDNWDGKTQFPELLDHFYEFFGYDENDQNALLKRFGSLKDHEKEALKKQKDLTQSAFSIEDIKLEVEEKNIAVRDGVKIDPRTNTAVNKAKYDYELVETAKPFEMVFEINKRSDVEIDYGYFKTFVGLFLQGISKGRIRFGAKSNKGFGVLKLEGTPQLAELDFSKKADLWAWLNNTPKDKEVPVQIKDLLKKHIEIFEKEFSISADFRIKNSLLIKSYPTKPEEPDAVHIKSNGKNIMPGTSVMGAVRHRAWKIINTMFDDNQIKREKFYNLFGYVETNDDYPEFPKSYYKKDENGKDVLKHPARKGRLVVNESIIENPEKSIIEQVQTRIKIDRFTGGTIAGALLQEKALWQSGKDSVLSLKMSIRDYEDWEPALLMFILKDLVTGDLPIGGEKSIGRGVLIGNAATIKWTNEPESVHLQFKDGFVAEQDQNKLTKFDPFMEQWKNVLKEKKKMEGATNE